MTRRLAFITLAGLVCLAGCPSDPYDYKAWTKKLSDSHESERAVQKLEELGNPGAIPALGDAWADQGKPVRFLQTIIALARPLTPAEAKEKFVTDFEKEGRPASWDAALPYLKKALLEVDEANPRSVDSASKAADALADAQLPGGLEALIDLSQKPASKKLITAQISAIHAIGKYESDKPAASAALVKLIDREPPPNPRTVAKENRAAAGDQDARARAVPHAGAVHADPARARRERPRRQGRAAQGHPGAEPGGRGAVQAGQVRQVLRRQEVVRSVPAGVGEGLLPGDRAG
jgi:hypothetical protein